MNSVKLGRSGLSVSRICLGTLTFSSPEIRPYFIGEEESRSIIRHALEIGIDFFDTADLYSNGLTEEILGRALNEFARREDVTIATKVGGVVGSGANGSGLSRKHILDAAEASLRRLGTDHIDLYQLHRWDTGTPIDETLSALDQLIRDGKIRYIGCSSCHAWQFAKALYVADANLWARFISMQNFYNLAYREEEREMLPLCVEEGIGVLPWSPGARGLLARGGGKADTVRSRSDDRIDAWFDLKMTGSIAARVAEIATRRGSPPMAVAAAWLLRQPAVVAPVIGVTSVEQLKEYAVAPAIVLDDDECAYLEAPYRPQPVQAMALMPRGEKERALIQ
jgi:aryl-alcohol dehydrogenase-like predicted oxidoreductase